MAAVAAAAPVGAATLPVARLAISAAPSATGAATSLAFADILLVAKSFNVFTWSCNSSKFSGNLPLYFAS